MNALLAAVMALMLSFTTTACLPPEDPPPAPAVRARTAATEAPAPTPVSGSTAVMDAMAARMAAAINAERTARGLAPLSYHGQLTAAAGIRLQHLAAYGLTHYLPNGERGYRVALSQVGYPWRVHYVGENLARNGYDASISPERSVASFMASSTHRDNVLNPNYRYVGVAHAVIGGLHYYVVIFSS